MKNIDFINLNKDELFDLITTEFNYLDSNYLNFVFYELIRNENFYFFLLDNFDQSISCFSEKKIVFEILNCIEKISFFNVYTTNNEVTKNEDKFYSFGENLYHYNCQIDFHWVTNKSLFLHSDTFADELIFEGDSFNLFFFIFQKILEVLIKFIRNFLIGDFGSVYFKNNSYDVVYKLLIDRFLDIVKIYDKKINLDIVFKTDKFFIKNKIYSLVDGVKYPFSINSLKELIFIINLEIYNFFNKNKIIYVSDLITEYKLYLSKIYSVDIISFFTLEDMLCINFLNCFFDEIKNNILHKTLFEGSFFSEKFFLDTKECFSFFEFFNKKIEELKKC